MTGNQMLREIRQRTSQQPSMPPALQVCRFCGQEAGFTKIQYDRHVEEECREARRQLERIPSHVYWCPFCDFSTYNRSELDLHQRNDSNCSQNQARNAQELIKRGVYLNDEAIVVSNGDTEHMEDMNADFDWVNHFPSTTLSDSEESIPSQLGALPSLPTTGLLDGNNFTERLLLHVKTKGLKQQVQHYDQKELDTIMVLDALVSAGVPNTAATHIIKVFQSIAGPAAERIQRLPKDWRTLSKIALKDYDRDVLRNHKIGVPPHVTYHAKEVNFPCYDVKGLLQEILNDPELVRKGCIDFEYREEGKPS